MRADVIVIGAGQGGVPLAAWLAGAGRKVMLIERGDLGGTCVNTGCTPTKTLIASARAAHVARTAARLGVHAGEVRVDFAAVMRRKDEVVGQWRGGVEKRLREAGVGVVRGHARLAGGGRVEVDGETHEAETIVVDVGLRPAIPPVRGLEEVPYLTNASILGLTELPRRLLVLGGGYIGCELGQAFRRFGSEVAIVDPGKHLMGREDDDVSEALEEAFRAEGIEILLGARAVEAAKTEEGVRLTLEDGRSLEGSHLLVATGRAPNTDDLGCGAEGIDLDEHGFIPVDDAYRTSAEGVYAIGDCTGGPQFTHTSWDDGRILFGVLTGARGGGRDERIVPYTAFTDPQVARVGLSEREAKEKGVEYELATMPFGSVARAIETDERAGVMKMLVDPETERILGAAFVGAQAGELIHVPAALMRAGATVRAITDGQMVHPTFAEGLQTLLLRLDRFAPNASSEKSAAKKEG